MMGSTWRRLKIYYINNFKALRNVVSIVVLVAIATFIVVPRLFGYRTSAYYKNHDGYAHDGSEPAALRTMVDTRPMRCRDHAYEFTRLDVHQKISIIAEFHGASFHDLRTTLLSIVEHTPYDLYTEIIILDDGSNNADIQKASETLLRNPIFNKVKMYSSESRDGPSASRFKAAAVSSGQILIFVDSSTVVNHGWMQPLIAKVIDDPTLIAVPHYDRLVDGDRFQRVDEDSVDLFTWRLATVSSATSVPPGTDLIATPVTRGEVFAVQRAFLERIGGFDEHLGQKDSGAAYHLELSLRAWMCGGSVQVSTCSRVAARDTHIAGTARHRVVEPRDVRRIVELWLDEFRSFVYRQTGVRKDEMSQREKDLLLNRRAYFRQQQQQRQHQECKSFGWYMDNVVRSLIVVPSGDAKALGKLHTRSGHCICTDLDDKVTLKPCNENRYERECVFELNERGAIHRDGLCLEATADTMHVELRGCEADSPRQRWWINDSKLTPVVAPRKCLTEVKDSLAGHQDSKDSGAVLSVQDCQQSADSAQHWRIINF